MLRKGLVVAKLPLCWACMILHYLTKIDRKAGDIMTGAGTSLPEQIIYLWLKQYFLEGEVFNRYLGYDGLEFDIAIPKLNFVIEYGNMLTHNYLLDNKPMDIKKVRYAETHGLTFLRIYNMQQNKKAYCENNLIVYNGAEDKFLIRQVLPLLSKFINSKYKIETNPLHLSEGIVIQAMNNVHKVKYIDSFGKRYSKIAKYWDIEGNYGMKPEKVSVESPHAYTFRCPCCNKPFAITLKKILRNASCSNCNVNFILDDVDRLYALDELDGLHENIDYFMLGDLKAECNYGDIIRIVIRQGIDCGKGSSLLNERLIKGLTDTPNITDYEIYKEYKYKIPANILEQYNMLMEIMICLDVDYSDIKVKLKRDANISNKNAPLFSLDIERKNIGSVKVLNENTRIYVIEDKVQSYNIYEAYREVEKQSHGIQKCEEVSKPAVYDLNKRPEPVDKEYMDNGNSRDDYYENIQSYIPSYIRYIS